MKCALCDYESSSLTDDDSEKEIERHTALEHSLSAIWLPSASQMLELHLKYNMPIDELMLKMREIRKKLSEENRQDYLRE